MSEPGPSKRVMAYEAKASKKVQGLMMAYDRIESISGAAPPEGHFAMALVLAVSSEAMVEAAKGNHPGAAHRLGDPEVRQQLTDCIDLLEHTINQMKEALKNGQH